MHFCVNKGLFRGLHRCCTSNVSFWDSCWADGVRIEECPVQVFQWYRTEQDVSAMKMAKTISTGTEQDHERDGPVDYTHKIDPIRESHCI
jgi:hypothetical protein